MNLQIADKHEGVTGEVENLAFKIHWQVSMAASLTSA